VKPRLLVIELHHLGDAVLATPFLRAAHQSHEVTVYCTSSVAAMLRTFFPDLAICIARESWPLRFAQAATILRKLRPAASVCAWADARAHLVARLSGSKKRLGFPMNAVNYYAPQIPWRRRLLKRGAAMENLASRFGLPLLTELLQRGSIQESHFHNWQRIAKALKIELPLKTPWFPFVPAGLPGQLEKFLEIQRRENRPLWVLHAGGRLETKRWPVERFEKLLQDYFARKNIPVLILTTADEEAPRPISDQQIQHVCSSHLELATLLNGSQFILCNDSYPAHLGAALGKTVFTIFGSGEPAWFSAFGNSHHVIRKPICPHHPCVDRCVMPSVVCLEAVTVEDVACFLDRQTAPGI
jgi:ADP-heptose:LPS heptosyltransferase